MQPSSPKSIAGITLIELIMAIAIVSILSLFVTQANAAVVHKARGSMAGINLVDSLTRARSLAVTRETDVVLCPSSDGKNCSSGDHWEGGWIGFSDIREDGERHGDEPLLIVQEALGARVHLISTSGRTRIRFQPTGTNRGSNVTFTLCDGRGPSKAVAWIMSNDGNLHQESAKPTAASTACYGG
jgi:type IV fimbrial biogenesis protein FimT